MIIHYQSLHVPYPSVSITIHHYLSTLDFELRVHLHRRRSRSV